MINFGRGPPKEQSNQFWLKSTQWLQRRCHLKFIPSETICMKCQIMCFSQKTGFDISCKLSPKETICMKCQILFFGKNKKKYFKMSSTENFIQSANR